MLTSKAEKVETNLHRRVIQVPLFIFRALAALIFVLYYWPLLKNDKAKCINNCVTCQKVK